MITRLTSAEAKAKFQSLLDGVATGQEFEITEHGRTVARLVPAASSLAFKGRLVGVAMTSGVDEDLFGTGAVWVQHRSRSGGPVDQSR